MSRAVLFVSTGVASFALWFVTAPLRGSTDWMQEWPNVLSFSGMLLLLAFSLLSFGRMLGGRWVRRLATIAGVTAAAMSVINVFEDGFRIEAMFFAFVLGLFILNGSLVALTLVIARTRPGWQRLLAVVPVATAAGIMLFPIVGGPLLLGAWLVAAAAALAPGMRDAAPEREAYVV